MSLLTTLPVVLKPTADQLPPLSTLPTSAFPALTGDVTTPGGSLATTLATVNGNVGTFTYGTFTVNAKGLITAASSGATPEVPLTFSTGLTRTVNTITANAVDLSATGSGGATGILAAGRFPALTGDITTASGALATTLATVNASAGTFSLHGVTVNGKGLITNIANVALTGDVTTVAGAVATTLATVNSNVGTFTNPGSVTVNGKGLITAIAAGAAAGFSLQAAASTTTPVSGSTVFFGSLFTLAPSTTATLMKLYIPVACTLSRAYVHILVAGTLGSAQNTTISFRLNNTTDTSISATAAHTAATNTVNNTGLAVTCAAGDFCEIKMLYPTFVTVPTNCQYSVTLYFTTT